MQRGDRYIRLELDIDQPIELGEFVGAFTALAAEYERYTREQTTPGTPPQTATLYVREVHAGSIVAHLVPVLIGGGAALIAVLGAANTVYTFVEKYGGKLQTYLKPGGRAQVASKTELEHFSTQVAAVANSPNSSLEVAAIEIVNGAETVRAAFKFSTAEAQVIQDRVAEHKREIDQAGRADHVRVLMTFTRSDRRNATIGKRSGEQVLIESVSDRSLPVIYASDLAEQQIRHEVADAEDNVYRKGFVVDVNLETRSGRPVAYSVTNLHQVIDLPED